MPGARWFPSARLSGLCFVATAPTASSRRDRAVYRVALSGDTLEVGVSRPPEASDQAAVVATVTPTAAVGGSDRAFRGCAPPPRRSLEGLEQLGTDETGIARRQDPTVTRGGSAQQDDRDPCGDPRLDRLRPRAGVPLLLPSGSRCGGAGHALLNRLHRQRVVGLWWDRGARYWTHRRDGGEADRAGARRGCGPDLPAVALWTPRRRRERRPVCAFVSGSSGTTPGRVTARPCGTGPLPGSTARRNRQPRRGLCLSRH